MLTVAVTPELDQARELATELQWVGVQAHIGRADGCGIQAARPAQRTYRVQVPAQEIVRARRLLRRR